MNIQTIMNYGLILIGAIVMLSSIVRVRGLLKFISTVPEYHQKQIKLFLVIHRELILFFFIGYISVLVAFAFHYSFVSETFVSLIFLSGSIFVYIGTIIQSRLLVGIQNTLKGSFPLCTTCKKIRVTDRGTEEWQDIDTFITEKSELSFSRECCPECVAREEEKIMV